MYLPRGKLATEEQFGDHFWKRVTKRTNEQVENSMRSTFSTFAALFQLGVTLILYNEFVGAPRWMSRSQDWVCIVFAVLLIGARVDPNSFLRHQRLPYLFSVIMFLVALAVSVSPKRPTMLMLSASYSQIFRIVMCSSYATDGKLWLVVFWNIVGLVVASYTYYDIESSGVQSGVTSLQYALEQSLSCIFAMMCHYSASQKLRTDAVNHLLNQSLHGKKSAMNSLLDVMCDVVVEVDSDLQLAEESQRLAAMMTPGSKSLVKGTCLEKFMPFDEDKDKYRRQLRSSGEFEGGGLAAGALHVKMRDSMSNVISVDLFYVQCSLYEDQQKHYLIGLRESADIPLAAMKSKPHPLPKNSSCGSDLDPSESEASDTGKVYETVFGAKDSNDAASCLTSDISSGSHTQSWASAKMSEFMPRTPKVRLLLREMQPTQDAGFTLSLILAMSRWNLKIHKASCCPVHAAIKALQTYAMVLNGYPCSQEFGPKGNIQCQQCGLVYGCDWRGRSEQVERCHACDSLLPTPCAAAPPDTPIQL